MNTLKVLLVDDELSAIEGLAIRLSAFSQIKISGQASTVDDALVLINQCAPDLIFLDIEMPGKSGFELVKQLQPEVCPAIVFVTAFHQYAVQAFEVRALDYLLKPVKTERLAEAINRVTDSLYRPASKQQMLAAVDVLQQSGGQASAASEQSYSIHQDKLVIQDGYQPVQLIPYADILWIDAAGDYMCVHTQMDTFVMRARMKSLIKETLPASFLRIHKSSIVNLQHITHIEPLSNSEYHATLTNNKVLKVSRTFSRELKARLSPNKPSH